MTFSRVLTVHARRYRHRAESTRFKNPWEYPEIRLGGMYLRAMGLEIGEGVRVSLIRKGTIVLRAAGKRTPKADRVLAVQERASGHMVLTLGGSWLKDAGFQVGGGVEVAVEGKTVVLTSKAAPATRPG